MLSRCSSLLGKLQPILGNFYYPTLLILTLGPVAAAEHRSLDRGVSRAGV